MKKCSPKVVHTAGVDNDAADALSRLDITDKANDARVWGEKSKRFEYINVHMMNICMFLSESEFEDDGLDDDAVMTMKEVDESSYPLDLKLMRTEQLEDEDLIRIVKNHLSGSGENGTVYTYKAVKDVELIHKNNSILVPRSKQQSVLDWYHNILVHPGEKRMIESIKMVFTWSGLDKQAKELISTCHEYQMCKKAGKKKYGLLPPKTAETTR